MGVYPLLQDESCWFLAADFDGPAWREDIEAFRETCASAGLPCAVERSRSGEGGHAWFLFRAPVPAHIARRMGCHLLTETMARRHDLAMTSYDRLFPNQDTMPRGGFGNLIALPLQHDARQHGNLDERFEPHADQWSYLASLPRISPTTVEDIADQAARRGLVVGVRGAGFQDDEEASAPWTRAPSGRAESRRITAPLPSEVRALVAQRVFVEKAGLPSQLLNQIKRLAAFQNPEFYKKQAMWLSTSRTPGVITCAEDLRDHVAVPRGCLSDLERLLADQDVSLEVEDRRNGGESLQAQFKGQLTEIQRKAARALRSADIGVIVAPPGAGKTVLGAYMVAMRAASALVLVHRRPLLEQWVTQLSMFLGIEETEVGRLGGGIRRLNGRLDVAMIQSLVRKDCVRDLIAEYGHVIVDECHHVPAVSFERVLSEVRARYVLGSTATPQCRDGHHPIQSMQLGPIRMAVDPKAEAASRPFEHRLVIRETRFSMPVGQEDATIQEIYRAIGRDERRNRMLVRDILAVVGQRRCPLVLTERREHVEAIAGLLRGKVGDVIVLRGGAGRKAQREARARLAHASAESGRVVLATGRYAGEGFDDPQLDTLILAMPCSWKGTLIQYAGRIHRQRSGKAEVRIYDYVDRDVPVLRRMSERRLRAYQAIGYVQRPMALACDA